MLMVLSPAKKLSFAPAPAGLALTIPELTRDIAELAQVTRKLKRADLKRLMSISDALADLNYHRFQRFDPAGEDGLQAVMAFAGDVYDGLQARTLDKKALAWAQVRLRILSGLYGVLKPLDALQPYRLEMGTRLKTRRGSSLYDFWRTPIAEALSRDAERRPDPTLVNLASIEYFGSVDTEALRVPYVTCHFKEHRVRGEAPQALMLFAKRARGLMARYAIDHRIERAEQLKAFDTAGYAFDPALSTGNDWVFTRQLPPKASSANEPAARDSRAGAG
ncbi:MAG TPA: peroxide stress protein YaaA [Caulobacteraceae bacterium]|nr:peroxide stress protein YaaA [Caulobacteraceae bacterium]